MKKFFGSFTGICLIFTSLILSGCGGGGNSTTTAQQTVPAAPAIGSTVSTSSQITLNWAPVADATSYNLYYSTSPGVTTANGTKVAGVTSPYNLTGLTDNTTYYIILTAVNSAGESTASTQKASVPSSTTPSAPTGVVAAAGDAQATITWTADPSADSYNIYWSTSAGVTTTNGTLIANVTSPNTITALTNGTPYYFIVTAVNGNGQTPSAEVTATPNVAAPAAPTGVTAVAGDGQVTISWAAVTGATSYNIYYSTISGVTTANGTQLANATSPNIVTGLTNGTPYYFIVTALNSGGEGAASSQVTATPTVSQNVPLSITTTSLPSGTYGTVYNQTLAATGGAPSYTWTFTGTLPAGLSLSSAGVISGTPVATGTPASSTSNFTVTATDSATNTATQALSITINVSASALSGKTVYDGNCSGCHSLGSYDTNGSPNLQGAGSLVDGRFSGGQNHHGVTLTAQQIIDVAAFISQF